MKNLVLIAIILFGIYWVYGKATQDNTWTLMVCDTVMSNGVDCQDTTYEIQGFKSSKECLLEGASRFSKEGFECGKGCRKGEYADINICEEICNKGGCS